MHEIYQSKYYSCMANVIKIKKGLDIRLQGAALAQGYPASLSDRCAIVPDDYAGLVPKVLVKVGDVVMAGTPVIQDKNRPEVLFVAPFSGVVESVDRGERRKLLRVVIKCDKENKLLSISTKHPSESTPEQIKSALLQAGIWPFIRQRPYDVVADPRVEPRDIFITGFDSAPLAPDMDYVLKGQEADFQTGLDALAKLTAGKVYLSISSSQQSKALVEAKRVVLTRIQGKHPAGNVGVQINHIKPVNKGETVWTLSAQDVLYIGRLFNKSAIDLSRTIALTGSLLVKAGYVSTYPGAQITPMVKSNVAQGVVARYISGNPLSGVQIAPDGFLSAYAQQITVIPEGNEVHELFGWALPGFSRFSTTRQYFSWLMPGRLWNLDARIKGGHRAIIMSEEYDKVLPMDILPEFLIKAIIAGNIDKMEELGIYEVAPEDFALCEFVDTSKTELQKIVRDGLEMLRKEMI